MIVVGLTGGIGTGKSTVGRILADDGVAVVDADRIARSVVAPGTEGLAQIVEAFGPDVLKSDGSLDRAAMRQRIATDPAAKAKLESITHPAIRQGIGDRVAELADQGATHAVVEAALLVETGSYRFYPELIVVTCHPAVQLARVVARDGVTTEAAKALIAAQAPMADKEAVATEVIHNNGTLQDLEVKTRAVWDAISRRAP